MTSFILPDSAINLIVEEVEKYGEQDVETGGFLLSSSDEPEKILVVACAGDGPGINRQALQFTMSGLAMNQLFDWAFDQNYRVVAQFHSHKHGAFMSYADQMLGLSVRGFISTIVPNYAAPSLSPSAWGWWVYEKDGWLDISAPQTTDLPCGAFYFDELGVT
jgi:hypothetical protein